MENGKATPEALVESALWRLRRGAWLLTSRSASSTATRW
ncbi:hypothetical protein ABLN97_04900 [Mycobacterium tuberculosis]